MDKNKEVDKIIKSWIGIAIQDFYLAFVLGWNWAYQRAFFLEQGVEKILKAYILKKRESEFKNFDNEARENKIDKICREYQHNIEKLIKDTSNNEFQELLDKDYDGYQGRLLVEKLPLIFEESRYLVPKNKSSAVPHKKYQRLKTLPIYSSGLQKFCFAIGKKVLEILSKEFSIELKKEDIQKLCAATFDLTDNSIDRFCSVFFKE